MNRTGTDAEPQAEPLPYDRDATLADSNLPELRVADDNDDQARPDQPLAPIEQQLLATLEDTISAGVKSFIEIGTALAQIRDGRLYRATHATFEEYCKARWDFTGSRARQLTDGAAVAKELESVTMVTPTSERHVRPLLRYQPEKRLQIWRAAIQGAAGQPVSESQMKQALTANLPVSEWPKSGGGGGGAPRHEVYRASPATLVSDARILATSIANVGAGSLAKLFSKKLKWSAETRASAAEEIIVAITMLRAVADALQEGTG